MIDKINDIYNQYDCGDISDTDAISEITEIFLKEHPEMESIFNEIDDMWNDGTIDSGDVLMRIMDIVEE